MLLIPKTTCMQYSSTRLSDWLDIETTDMIPWFLGALCIVFFRRRPTFEAYIVAFRAYTFLATDWHAKNAYCIADTTLFVKKVRICYYVSV